MRVTILGAGRMGSAMAARLADTGLQVTIWDRDVDHARQAVRDGVAAAGNASAAVADAYAVITMVTNGEAVHDVAELMLPAMPRDAIWLQASTVGADWADRLGALADTCHRTMLDAPVSGSTRPARTGTLSWLVSGPSRATEIARPVLDALGERVIVVGDAQQASRLKLVVNTWITATTVAIADALAAADRLNVPRSTLLDVIGHGPLAMPYAIEGRST